MSKRLSVAVAIAAVTVAVAGCHSGGKVKSDLASASANPAVAAAQAKIQACVAKDGFLTKTNRQNLITCIAPAGTKATVELCIQAAVSTDNLLVTKADRVKFEQTDAPNCVVAASSTPTPAASHV